VVKTCTWLLVTSGTAPIGICDNEYRPTRAIAVVKSKTMNLFLILKLIIFENMIHRNDSIIKME